MRLAETDQSLDTIFRDPANQTGSPNAFVGTDDYYRESSRNVGAMMHLDPHRTYGYLRAITGDLAMTAAQWRGETGQPDTAPPRVSGLSATVGGTVYLTSDGPAAFSPNGDRIADAVRIGYAVSEPAHVTIRVTEDDGTVVRSMRGWTSKGKHSVGWNGRDRSGRRPPDGQYNVTITARDLAGNMSQPRSIAVRLLTALRAPRSSIGAIHAGDDDSLDGSVRFSVELKESATVTWRLLNRAGDVVRTRYASQRMEPAELTWSWYGQSETGATVPDGWYRAVVTAATPSGTVTYARSVYVGAFRFRVSDSTPQMGQRVRFDIFNTEALKAAATLKITQPGVTPYEVKTRRIGAHHLMRYITLREGGTAGTILVQVAATDVGGQFETKVFRLPIH